MRRPRDDGGEKTMSSSSLHTTAFILSLTGGLIITIGSVIAALLPTLGLPFGMHYGMGPGMMDGYWFGYGSGWMLGLILASFICGIFVVFGAIMLNARPAEHVTWGIIVLVFSIASFIGMGGYFVGAILGIAGGAVALSYRATRTTREE